MSGMGRAVVIGASMAGLATAGVLAKRFGEVTLIEARPLPAPDAVASIAPQGEAPHLLLGGGREALEAIFPGLTLTLMSSGATTSRADLRRFWYHGYRAKPPGDPAANPAAPLCSRAMLETAVRARVLALPNVRFVAGHAAALSAGGATVRGVRLTTGERLDADLVVDCAGRASVAARWLSQMGLEPPELETVGVDVRYVSTAFERRPGDVGGDVAVFIQNTPPHGRRFGLAVAVEDDRWQVILGGYFGEAPRDEDQEFLAFARTLPVGDIAVLLAGRRRTEPFFRYNFPRSQRRRFGAMRRLPRGFVCLGDAVGSFNPVFGQGMTSAALQAVALGANLDRWGATSRLVRAQVRAADAIVDGAWRLSTSPDLRYPQAVGRRAPASALTNAYADLALRAANTDHKVAAALGEVTNRLWSPATLLRPEVALRVLAAQRAGEPTSPIAQARHCGAASA